MLRHWRNKTFFLALLWASLHSQLNCAITAHHTKRLHLVHSKHSNSFMCQSRAFSAAVKRRIQRPAAGAASPPLRPFHIVSYSDRWKVSHLPVKRWAQSRGQPCRQSGKEHSLSWKPLWNSRRGTLRPCAHNVDTWPIARQPWSFWQRRKGSPHCVWLSFDMCYSTVQRRSAALCAHMQRLYCNVQCSVTFVNI